MHERPKKIMLKRATPPPQCSKETRPWYRIVRLIKTIGSCGPGYSQDCNTSKLLISYLFIETQQLKHNPRVLARSWQIGVEDHPPVGLRMSACGYFRLGLDSSRLTKSAAWLCLDVTTANIQKNMNTHAPPLFTVQKKVQTTSSFCYS